MSAIQKIGRKLEVTAAMMGLRFKDRYPPRPRIQYLDTHIFEELLRRKDADRILNPPPPSKLKSLPLLTVIERAAAEGLPAEKSEYLDSEIAAAMLGMTPGAWMLGFARTRGLSYRGPEVWQGDIARHGKFKRQDVERIARRLHAEASIEVPEEDWLAARDCILGQSRGESPSAAQLDELRGLGVRIRRCESGYTTTVQICAFDLVRLAACDAIDSTPEGQGMGKHPRCVIAFETMQQVEREISALEAEEQAPIVAEREERRARIIAAYAEARATYHAGLKALREEELSA